MPWSDLIGELTRRLARNAGGNTGRAGWIGEARIVAVAPWFPVRKQVRVLPGFDPAALADSSPNVVGAPALVLLRMAEEALGQRLRLPGLDRALISWSSIGEELLKPTERDLLWLAFQVPVFEELRGPRGELLAWECEAHRGLHVVERRAVFVAGQCGELSVCLGRRGGRTTEPRPLGLEGRVETGTCACGRLGRRLIELRNRTVATAPAWAETAAG